MTKLEQDNYRTSDQRYVLLSDDSGHEYFIKVGDEGAFDSWVAFYEDDDQDGDYVGPDFNENRIDGRFTFTDPRNQ
jgi:hypothetical protein